MMFTLAKHEWGNAELNDNSRVCWASGGKGYSITGSTGGTKGPRRMRTGHLRSGLCRFGIPRQGEDATAFSRKHSDVFGFCGASGGTRGVVSCCRKRKSRA